MYKLDSFEDLPWYHDSRSSRYSRCRNGYQRIRTSMDHLQLNEKKQESVQVTR